MLENVRADLAHARIVNGLPPGWLNLWVKTPLHPGVVAVMTYRLSSWARRVRVPVLRQLLLLITVFIRRRGRDRHRRGDLAAGGDRARPGRAHDPRRVHRRDPHRPQLRGPARGRHHPRRPLGRQRRLLRPRRQGHRAGRGGQQRAGRRQQRRDDRRRRQPHRGRRARPDPVAQPRLARGRGARWPRCSTGTARRPSSSRCCRCSRRIHGPSAPAAAP